MVLPLLTYSDTTKLVFSETQIKRLMSLRRRAQIIIRTNTLNKTLIIRCFFIRMNKFFSDL